MGHRKDAWLRLGAILTVLLLIGHVSAAVTGTLSAPPDQWSDATPAASAPPATGAPGPEPSTGGFSGAVGSKGPALPDVAAPTERDSDDDQIPDAEDNCPLSFNPDQADSNDNRLGDPCDAPFWEGFAFVTPTGVVQTRVDERGRPIQMVAPDVLLTLSWSDDASQFEITVQTDGESITVALPIDLSDAGLLQAFDAAEAEMGRDLTTLRAWVGDHPGQVLAVARGELPPYIPTADLNTSGQRAPGHGSMILPQPAATPTPTSTERYVEARGRDTSEALAAWHRVAHAPERVSMDALTILTWVHGEEFQWGLAMAMLESFERDRAACLPCSAACPVVCNPKGSCFFGGPGQNECESLFESECRSRGGVFFEGSECVGACWAFSNGESGCFDYTKTECLAIPDLSRAGGGQGNITTRFCPNQTCSDPPCPPPQ